VQVYDYFTDPALAQALGMFTRFHLLDLGQLADKTLEGHKSVALMEKLLKYSRDRDLFQVISQELERLRDWLLGTGMTSHPIGFDYWETVLLYTSSVLNPKYNSEEELVALFAEKLSKDKEEVMQTIAQQIERRIRPQLERKIRLQLKKEIRLQLEKEIRAQLESRVKREIEESINKQESLQTKAMEIAQNMLKDQAPKEKVSKWTGLDLQAIERLLSEISFH